VYHGLPARIEGRATGTTTLKEERTGQVLNIAPGRFVRSVPAGRYAVSCGGFEWKLDMVSGRHYRRNFDPQKAIDNSLSTAAGDSDVVHLKLNLRGQGDHAVELRLFNCETAELKKQVTLAKGVNAVIE
jgi:hypothetical protein